VVDTAVTNGANRVENVRFTLSTETRQRLRTSALKDAMAAPANRPRRSLRARNSRSRASERSELERPATPLIGS
jgi:uncharacterized protein YggE